MAEMLGRRAFLGALGLLTAPRAAEAQPVGKVARVGILWVGSIPEVRAAQALFDAAMGERGWVEGRNLLIERRYVQSADQLRPAAAELVG